MTRDKIIRMMIEACDTDKVGAWHNGFWTITQEELERFAALVAAAQREECAQVCEAITWSDEAKFFAKAIRERT
jgi:L-ascorbate metabolism protein UlaG (beta-lactamase superfamily)